MNTQEWSHDRHTSQEIGDAIAELCNNDLPAMQVMLDKPLVIDVHRVAVICERNSKPGDDPIDMYVWNGQPFECMIAKVNEIKKGLTA